MTPESRRCCRCLVPWLAGLLAVQVTSVGAQGHEHQPAHEHGAAHAHDEDHGDEGKTHTHGLRHDFSDAEHWSAIFDSEERRSWQMPEHVIDLMAVVPGMTLVDLGAGTGFFSKPLSEAAGPQGRVLALDPEENLVAFMNERAAREGLSNVEARVIPHDDPQLEDGSVDRILIVNTWHHISDRAEYSTKLLRALKAGGQIFIVDFEMDSPSGPPRQHRLEPEEILQDLRGGGLEARQMGDELPRQYVIVGSKGEG